MTKLVFGGQIDWNMMTSSKGNIFRVTGLSCGEFIGHRWIPLTKASDAELWSFLWLGLYKRLSKQSRGWWFETPSCSLWRYCNDQHWHEAGDKPPPETMIVRFPSWHVIVSIVLGTQMRVFDNFFQMKPNWEHDLLQKSRSYLWGVFHYALQISCLRHYMRNFYDKSISSYGIDYCLPLWARLTHWGRDKMAAVSQTTRSNALSWMKILKFRLRFHRSLFLRVQLTIIQHWFT